MHEGDAAVLTDPACFPWRARNAACPHSIRCRRLCRRTRYCKNKASGFDGRV